MKSMEPHSKLAKAKRKERLWDRQSGAKSQIKQLLIIENAADQPVLFERFTDLLGTVPIAERP